MMGRWSVDGWEGEYKMVGRRECKIVGRRECSMVGRGSVRWSGGGV